MDRKIKERLIGLVVLLTLAVIFLPMFLGGPDESVERRRVPLATETEESLPETRLDLNGTDTSDDRGTASVADPADDGDSEDGVTVTGLDEPAEEATSATDTGPGETSAAGDDAATEATEATGSEANDPSPASEPTSDDSAAADTGTEETEDATDTATPSREAADEAGESAGDDSSDGEAVPTGSGWTAQVGSFTHRDNADDLISQLRGQGFEAFLMRHRTDGQTFYRVRVGLEPDRESAVSLAERIHRETGHEAAPVPHP